VNETPVYMRPTWFHRLSQLAVGAVLAAIARVRLVAPPDLPREGGMIVVANHSSNADPPLVGLYVGRALGRPVHFMAKGQLFVPILRPWLRRIGAIRVAPGGRDVEAYRAARGVLAAGGVVCIFPEGTRSPTGTLIEAHKGVALLAARTRTPVLPVGIGGAQRLLPKDSPLPRIGTRVTVRIGEPFTLTLDPTIPRREAIARASDELMGRIAALLPPEQRGRYG
jgi:1-acyl-sn-glycerol-3-phosphate acyltransferase